jgi:hypothetical protein
MHHIRSVNGGQPPADPTSITIVHATAFRKALARGRKVR